MESSRQGRSSPGEPPRELHGSCYWLAAAAPGPPAPPLRRPTAVDCAVVGAGLTGLAAARRLAEHRPEWRIAVVDAGSPGAGASGRSSGFVVEVVDFLLRLPAEERARYVRLARFGIDLLREMTEHHGIDCDWDARGWIRGAAGDAGMRCLDEWPRLLDEAGLEFQWLDHGAMEELTGTPFYRAGLRLPGSLLVQPAALVRGLAAALPAGVTLHGDTPVSRIVPRPGGGYVLGVPAGELVARRVLLAANAFCPQLGFERWRVQPVWTFGSATRPLDARERRQLGGEETWGLLATDPMGSTLRRTPDQRLVVRNTLAVDPGGPDPHLLRRAAANHRAALAARFPVLAEVPFEHTWGGAMGITRNRLPRFAELAPGLAVAAGFSGAGIATGTAAGTLLADLLAGADSPLLRDQLALPQPPPLPPGPLRRLGARWTVWSMNRKAGAAL